MDSHPARPGLIPIFEIGIRRACVRGLLIAGASLSLIPPPWAQGASQTVEVVARIEPELSMTITPETGDRIDLGTTYSAQTEPRLSQPVRVTLRVFSNLGQPYDVTQQLVSPLTSDTGVSLASDDLLVFGDDGSDVQGRGAGQPQTLFSSDPLGRSMDRSVSYRLRVPPGQAAGTYRGTLLMSVTAK